MRDFNGDRNGREILLVSIIAWLPLIFFKFIFLLTCLEVWVDLSLDVDVEPDCDLDRFTCCVPGFHEGDELTGVEGGVHVHVAAVLQRQTHLPLLLAIPIEIDPGA